MFQKKNTQNHIRLDKSNHCIGPAYMNCHQFQFPATSALISSVVFDQPTASPESQNRHQKLHNQIKLVFRTQIWKCRYCVEFPHLKKISYLMSCIHKLINLFNKFYDSIPVPEFSGTSTTNLTMYFLFWGDRFHSPDTHRYISSMWIWMIRQSVLTSKSFWYKAQLSIQVSP